MLSLSLFPQKMVDDLLSQKRFAHLVWGFAGETFQTMGSPRILMQQSYDYLKQEESKMNEHMIFFNLANQSMILAVSFFL
ncbi:hypothetical protein OIU79_002932 [Salix purpurea]|uniref:Uncharacterized protein n=1 Tax=Salix purpurea TaxID=77065 RepID=A0A9Q0UK96_SALPP|nr:hypothetical protein OIU79_002932 [Salix purpurea]